MKTLTRIVALILAAGFLAVTTASAGNCCKQAAKDAKDGKTCEKCLTDKCCKEAAKNVKDAKACEKCAAKAKKAEKKS